MSPTGGLSLEVQQWIRVGLYLILGAPLVATALAKAGIVITDNDYSNIASIIGIAGNICWTIWGGKLSNLLERAKAKAGVEEVAVKVNPDLVSPEIINKATSSGITATHDDIFRPDKSSQNP